MKTFFMSMLQKLVTFVINAGSEQAWNKLTCSSQNFFFRTPALSDNQGRAQFSRRLVYLASNSIAGKNIQSDNTLAYYISDEEKKSF
jgi:hypothetical protein